MHRKGFLPFSIHSVKEETHKGAISPHVLEDLKPAVGGAGRQVSSLGGEGVKEDEGLGINPM